MIQFPLEHFYGQSCGQSHNGLIPSLCAMLVVSILFLLCQHLLLVNGDAKFLSSNCSFSDEKLGNIEICDVSDDGSVMNIIGTINRPMNKILVSLCQLKVLISVIFSSFQEHSKGNKARSS